MGGPLSRYQLALPLSIVSAIAFLAPPVLAQSGTIAKILKDGRARIDWESGSFDFREDDVGLVLEGDRALAAFRILSSKKRSSVVQIFEPMWSDVVVEGQMARLHHDSGLQPVTTDQAALFVWSDDPGGPLHVDGKAAGRAPMTLALEPGQHEILLTLSGGQKAGARIEVRPGMRRILCLHGRARPLSVKRKPRHHWLSSTGPPRPDSSGPLQWLDYADGTRIFRSSGPVKNPRITNKVVPRYPESARRSKISGRVVLEAVLTADGEVRGLEVLESPDVALEVSALEAASHWRYEPAILDGEPVPILFYIIVDFYFR